MSKAIERVQEKERVRRAEAEQQRQADDEWKANYPAWLNIGVDPSEADRRLAKQAARDLFDELSDRFGADVAREAFRGFGERSGQGNKASERVARRTRAWVSFFTFMNQHESLGIEAVAELLAQDPLGDGLQAAHIAKVLGKRIAAQRKYAKEHPISAEDLSSIG